MRTGLATAFILIGSLALLARMAVAQECKDTSEGRVCSVQQPIISGVPVPPALQRDLGLVTVGSGCSGTLVNRYWVLTADHCVTTNAKMGGPSAAFSSVTISAAWSPRVVVPIRFVRTFFSAGRDVALIFLGHGDFGDANIQLTFVEQVDGEMTLTKYGRGIFVYATGASPANAVPAQQDGQYRSARFTPSTSGAITYTLPVNAANQVGEGGDSGGPDIATAPNGIGLGITGVQSTCIKTGTVPGMPTNVWTWVTGVSSCDSAALHEIRLEIIQIIQERPPVSLVPVYYVGM